MSALAQELQKLEKIALRYETAIRAVDAALFAIDAGELLAHVAEGHYREHNAAAVLLGTIGGMLNSLQGSSDWELSSKLWNLAREAKP